MSVSIFVYVIPLVEFTDVYLADYTVQASRYQIIEEVGCVDSIAAVGLSLVVVIMWPIILCCISVLFYCRTFVYFCFCPDC